MTVIVTVIVVIKSIMNIVVMKEIQIGLIQIEKGQIELKTVIVIETLFLVSK